MYAAGALWNLAASSEALERRFAEAGAVEAPLQAMAVHRGVAAMQGNAAGALPNRAAGSEALKQRLAGAGAMEALLQPMALHREVAAVQVNAAGALRIWPSALLRSSTGSPTQEPWRHCSRPWPCIEK